MCRVSTRLSLEHQSLHERDADAKPDHGHAYHSAKKNPKLKLLWENIGDVTFVRDYRRKKKQPCKRRAETDEEFIEEMFSEVGMEQDHEGYHVV